MQELEEEKIMITNYCNKKYYGYGNFISPEQREVRGSISSE
jgi:hypothetical protein